MNFAGARDELEQPDHTPITRRLCKGTAIALAADVEVTSRVNRSGEHDKKVLS